MKETRKNKMKRFLQKVVNDSLPLQEVLEQEEAAGISKKLKKNTVSKNSQSKEQKKK